MRVAANPPNEFFGSPLIGAISSASHALSLYELHARSNARLTAFLRSIVASALTEGVEEACWILGSVEG